MNYEASTERECGLKRKKYDIIKFTQSATV